MLFEDFNNYDGDLEKLLAEISEWIREHKPVKPVLVSMEQNSRYLHFRLYMNDYEQEKNMQEKYYIELEDEITLKVWHNLFCKPENIELLTLPNCLYSFTEIQRELTRREKLKEN